MRRLVVLTLLSAIHQCAVAASEPAVEARNGMVVSSRHLASEIGVEILKHGGSTVDAIVAVGYAQALANLCCGSIDGGLMTIRLADGRGGVINFREATPAAASANTYLNESGNVRRGESLQGYRAVGVPGTVRRIAQFRRSPPPRIGSRRQRVKSRMPTLPSTYRSANPRTDYIWRFLRQA